MWIFLRRDEQSSFSGPFLAERLKVVSLRRKQFSSYHNPYEVLREVRTNRKWTESSTEEHIKLLIAGDIVVVTWESDDFGIHSL